MKRMLLVLVVAVIMSTMMVATSGLSASAQGGWGK